MGFIAISAVIPAQQRDGLGPHRHNQIADGLGT